MVITKLITIMKQEKKNKEKYMADTDCMHHTWKYMYMRESRNLHVSLHVYFRAKIDHCPKTGYAIFLQILYVLSQIWAISAYGQVTSINNLGLHSK